MSDGVAEKRPSQVEQQGVLIGQSIPNIWAPDQELIGSVDAQAGQHVLSAYPFESSRKTTALRIIAWSSFSMGLVFFLMVSAGWWLLSSLFFWWFLIWSVLSAGAGKRAYQVEQTGLFTITRTAALNEVDNRRAQARSYNADDSRGLAPFVPGGPAPMPQPYGVSHEGAEYLVAEWVRYLGEADSEITRFVSDGGVDVQSQHYIAQVKNYSGTVGVAEVRELGGVASIDGRKPLFFTSGSYAAGAIEFAERSGMALFVYDAQLGTLAGANEAAEHALAKGL